MGAVELAGVIPAAEASTTTAPYCPMTTPYEQLEEADCDEESGTCG